MSAQARMSVIVDMAGNNADPLREFDFPLAEFIAETPASERAEASRLGHDAMRDSVSHPVSGVRASAALYACAAFAMAGEFADAKTSAERACALDPEWYGPAARMICKALPEEEALGDSI